MIALGAAFFIVGSLLSWSAIGQIRRGEADAIVWRNAFGGLVAIVVGLVFVFGELLN